MKPLVFLFVFLFVFLSFTSLSQSFVPLKDTKTFKQEMKKFTSEMKTLEVEVEESKHLSILNEVEKGKGKLYYQQKDMIRWEMNNPGKNVFLFCNHELKMMENGKEIKSPNQKQIGKKIHEMMLSLLSGNFLDEKLFNIVYESNKNQFKLLCTPKNKQMKNNLQRLECYFNKENYLCEKLVFVENENNKVIYVFFNPKVNVSLPKNIFKQF
ncbi:MAG: outer membrane lipoprotein carrier protein LolA [Flavobacteriia bacterium]|nr:outer membrane lipoprotein carrier protein LolA [Flavobacteriia bacterium]